MMKKVRIDRFLVDKNFCENIETAQRLLLSGRVRCNGILIDKPGQLILPDSIITLKDINRYVSRGGLKLEKGAKFFQIDFQGKVVMDIGCSTGGFTDFALQHDAAKVYAIDVGKGVLDYKLRNDQRVILHEEVNFRYVDFELIGEYVDIIVGDLSFISLKQVRDKVAIFCKDGAEICLLIKPQFEVNKDEVGKGGIVTDFGLHKRVIAEVIDYYSEKFLFCGLTKSPIKGVKSNIEYLVFFVYNKTNILNIDIESIIEKVVDEEYSYYCKTAC